MNRLIVSNGGGGWGWVAAIALKVNMFDLTTHSYVPVVSFSTSYIASVVVDIL